MRKRTNLLRNNNTEQNNSRKSRHDTVLEKSVLFEKCVFLFLKHLKQKAHEVSGPNGTINCRDHTNTARCGGVWSGFCENIVFYSLSLRTFDTIL